MRYRCSILVGFSKPPLLVEYHRLQQVVERAVHGACTDEGDGGYLIEWEEDAIVTPGWAGGVAQLQPRVTSLAIATLQSLGYTTETAEILGYSIERVRT